MIEINQRRFRPAPRSRSAVWPSLGPGETGYYCFRKNGTMFFDKNGYPRIFLVDNNHGEQFFVTASMREDGRIWYMYSLTAKDEELIGIKGWSYSASQSLARAVCTAVRNTSSITCKVVARQAGKQPAESPAAPSRQ